MYYLNIHNNVCYSSDEERYASRLIIKIVYHIIMLTKK